MRTLRQARQNPNNKPQTAQSKSHKRKEGRRTPSPELEPAIAEAIANYTPKQLENYTNQLATIVHQLREKMEFEKAKEIKPGQSFRCPATKNTWIKLGVSPAQAERLKRAAEIMFKSGRGSAVAAAWYLLNAALANLEFMETLIAKDCQRAVKSGVSKEHIALTWFRKSRAVLENLN